MCVCVAPREVKIMTHPFLFWFRLSASAVWLWTAHGICVHFRKKIFNWLLSQRCFLFGHVRSTYCCFEFDYFLLPKPGASRSREILAISLPIPFVECWSASSGPRIIMPVVVPLVTVPLYNTVMSYGGHNNQLIIPLFSLIHGYTCLNTSGSCFWLVVRSSW